MGVSNGELMFSCECDEPEGKVIRNVYAIQFTPDNLQQIWDKASKFKTLMGWEIPSYEHLILFFMTPDSTGTFHSRGLCARIDDFTGVFWLSDINTIKEPFSASIHYTFFDRRHRGRLELCRTAVMYVFETYGFERLWTKVPLYMYGGKDKGVDKRTFKWSVLDFVERIGFRKEGRLHNDMQLKGVLYDANLYAITKAEAISGEAFKKADLKYTGRNQSWVAPQLIIASK